MLALTQNCFSNPVPTSVDEWTRQSNWKIDIWRKGILRLESRRRGGGLVQIPASLDRSRSNTTPETHLAANLHVFSALGASQGHEQRSLHRPPTLIEPSQPHKSTRHAPSRPRNVHNCGRRLVYWVVFASSISFRMLRISSMASFSLRTNSFSSSSWAGALTSVSANLDGKRIAVSSQLNAE